MPLILPHLRQALKNGSDEKTRESARRFFKDEIKLYGVKTPVVQKIARQYFKEIKNQTKTEIWKLCEELWQSGYIEESFVACEWSYALRKQYQPEDIKVFEKWIDRYITNWASCDTFCNHTVGAFIEMYPEYLSQLKKWTKSKNRWMRRASAVSLIIPAKRGKFLNDVFTIANTLLLDKEDMVQKGYGWLLKVASQAHQKEIFDYVLARKAIMPRTALRYAIEKMPKEMKVEAMEK